MADLRAGSWKRGVLNSGCFPWKNMENSYKLGESSRGNTIRGKTQSLWQGNLPLRGSLRGPLTSVWRISENLWTPLEALPLIRDPSLRGRFPSQRLSVLLPLIVSPLELSPTNSPNLREKHRFRELSMFFQGKHPPNSEKHPLCTNRLTNRPSFVVVWCVGATTE